MDQVAFKNALAESRNGANYFVRHWAVRNFQFSDGVEELAKAGCMWLVDMIATEAPKRLRDAYEGQGGQGIINVRVVGSVADITLSVDDDGPNIWSRHIEYTDMPEGEYAFVLADEIERFALILISEY